MPDKWGQPTAAELEAGEANWLRVNAPFFAAASASMARDIAPTATATQQKAIAAQLAYQGPVYAPPLKLPPSSYSPEPADLYDYSFEPPGAAPDYDLNYDYEDYGDYVSEEEEDGWA